VGTRPPAHWQEGEDSRGEGEVGWADWAALEELGQVSGLR
jgi:hypothetical protein